MRILKILIFIFFTVVSYSQTDNLLKNGGFESRTDYWKTYNSTVALANFNQVDYESFSGGHSLRVNVNKLGKNPWDVNLVQPFKSRKGINYEIKFYAKANKKGKSIKVQLQNTTYNSKDFFLTDEWEQYVWVTTAEESNLELSIHFLKKGDYFLDNLNIRKIRKTTVLSNSVSDDEDNLMVNGGFENGFENWVNASSGGSRAEFKLNAKRAFEGKVCNKVNVLKLGKNPWDIQSIYDKISLKKNKKYELRFNARGLGNKSVVIQFQNESKGIYVSKEINVNFEWQNYVWEITPQTNNMILTIHYIDRGIVEMDNFSIKRL